MAPVVALIRRAGLDPREGVVFSWGAATSFLIGWASVSLANVSDTLFLKRVGVDFLPAVFLASSLLLVVTTLGVARVAARAVPLRLLRQAFLVLALVLLPLWLLVLADLRSAFVLLMVAAKQFESIALMVFWVALGGLLHGRQAKRLYAPIIAGGTLGELAGSFASGVIGNTFGIAALVPVAAVAIGCAALLAVPLGSPTPVPLAPEARRGAPSARRARAVWQTVQPLWRGSRLFQLLVLSALLSGMLGPLLYFQFSYVADLATQGSDGEQRLLAFYAWFRGYLNAGVLVVQLVGTSWLFRRLGVPLASTVSPLVYLLGLIGFSLHLGLPVAILAMAAATLQDHAIYDPAHKILVTLFPERLRPAATTLTEGPVRRLGGALGNIVVLGVLALATPGAVALVGVPIAGAWLAVAVVLWRVYPTLLLEVAQARRTPLDRTLPLPELVDRATLRVLEASLGDPDPERCRAACALVADAPLPRAIEALARAIEGASTATQSLLIGTLHRLLGTARVHLRSAPAAAHLAAVLAGNNSLPDIERAHLLQAYADLAPDLGPDSQAVQVLRTHLKDPAECVRLAATARLQRAGLAPAQEPDVDTLLAAALLREDPCVRHVALDELRAALVRAEGRPGAGAVASALWEFRIAQLVALLDASQDRARAAEVLGDIAAHHGDRVAASADLVVAHMRDPDPRVRTAVLRFIGHAQLEAYAGWVVERLAADDDAEAEAARQALLVIGPAAVNALLDALHFGKRATREAVLPILRQMPIDTVTLRTLIDREVDTIRSVLLRRQALRRGPASDLVLQRLGERIDESLQATLLLLATLLHEERLAAIGRLLARTHSARGRAVLIEALEALLPPEERTRLLPLLEDRDSLAPALASTLSTERPPSYEEAMQDSAIEPDRWTAEFLAASDILPLARKPNLGDDQGNGEEPSPPLLSRVEIVLHLRSLELFSSLTTRQLSDLADVIREESHPPGTTIVSEGEFGDCMYLIISGEVRIMREGRFVARLGPREFFGEMALFDGEMRSASAIATERVRVLRLERQDLLALMDDQPAIAIAVCQTLSRRVRNLLARLECGAGEPQGEPATSGARSDDDRPPRR